MHSIKEPLQLPRPLVSLSITACIWFCNRLLHLNWTWFTGPHLTEVLCIFSGVNCFSRCCLSAGFTLYLLFIHLTIFYLLGREDHQHMLIWGPQQSLYACAFLFCRLFTYITGLLTGLLWHLVSRSKMCRETTFTSLLLILFCVGILEEDQTLSPQ